MTRSSLTKAVLVLGFTVLALGATMELAHAQAEDGSEEPAAQKPASGGTLKTVGAYALGLIGVGILVIAVTQTVGKPSYPQARLTLVNMLRTHPNHAEMLARNMVHTFGEAIGNAMKTASAAGSPDPKVLQSALAPTYDGLGQAIVAHWKAVLGKGKLGVMAAVGGFVLGLTGDGFPIGPFLMALVAAGCFLRVFLFTHETQQNLVRARAEVLPEALNAMASGRYVFPPPPV
jgi:hypothetical protein